MTDQNTSPLFESRSGSEHEHARRLSFNAMGLEQIKFVCGSATHDCVQSLYFLDRDRNVIAAYDPYKVGHGNKKHVLEDTEEVIGVYGVMGKTDWLSSFGLMTRVRK